MSSPTPIQRLLARWKADLVSQERAVEEFRQYIAEVEEALTELPVEECLSEQPSQVGLGATRCHCGAFKPYQGDLVCSTCWSRLPQSLQERIQHAYTAEQDLSPQDFHTSAILLACQQEIREWAQNDAREITRAREHSRARVAEFMAGQ